MASSVNDDSIEQKALLMVHQEELVLVTDDDDPEPVWQKEEAALAGLKQEGWVVEVGPSILHAQVAGEPGREVRGYVFRRSLH